MATIWGKDLTLHSLKPANVVYDATTGVTRLCVDTEISNVTLDADNVAINLAKYSTTLPTYSSNTTAPLQVSSKGCGLFQMHDGATGLKVAVDDSAMPATPPFIPIGGEYRATPTTYADGDATVLQTDSHGNTKSVITDGTDTALVDDSGNLMVSLGTELSGEDVTNDQLMVVGKTAHDSAIPATQHPLITGLEYADFDGSALPNSVDTEGDAVRAKASAYGVQYVMPVNEDGSAIAEVEVSQVTAADLNCTEANSGDIKTAVEAIDNNTAPQAYGIDAAGADTYTTIVTADAERHHISISLQGENDAIVSLDGGTTNSFYIPAGSSHVFDNVLISDTANVQGKNADAGNNYTKLSITIW